MTKAMMNYKGEAFEELFSYNGWNDLYNVLHGATLEDAREWMKYAGNEDEYEEIEDRIFVYGFYHDETPVIQFENGIVARWWRNGCWD